MPASFKRPSVRTRVLTWGIGILLCAVFALVLMYSKSGRERAEELKSEATKNLVKIDCRGCGNDPKAKVSCVLCGGVGKIWVPETALQTN